MTTETETLNYSGQLVVSICWCGMRHAVPKELHDFQQRAHDNGEKQRGIYCPLGHTYINAGDGEAARLKKQLERERDAKERLMRQRDAEAKAHSATKGQLTKARKRAVNGVCPCCSRSFVDVASHVRKKHAAFAKDQGANEVSLRTEESRHE